MMKNTQPQLKKLINQVSTEMGYRYAALRGDKIVPAYHFDTSISKVRKLRIISKHSFQINGIKVLCVSGGRYKGLLYQDCPIKHKTETIYVIKGEEVLATATFSMYSNDMEKQMDVMDFWDECDGDSQEASDFGSITQQLLEKNMNRSFLYPKEQLVELSVLKVSPKCRGQRLWVKPLNEYIRIRFSDPCFNVLLIHAYPMEYIGLADLLPEKNMRDMKKRTEAMVRYYGRVLDAQRIDDTAWLYRGIGKSRVRIKLPKSIFIQPRQSMMH